MGSENEKMVTVEEAIERILGSVEPLEAETISILDATGRVLYEDAISPFDVPPLDNSAMDGYAIIAGNTSQALTEKPAVMTITEEIKAGGNFEEKRVTDATAIRIMTGAPIPEGADSVVEIESTLEEDERVLVFRRVTRGENIRRAGEDIEKGSVVLRRGVCHRLQEGRPTTISLPGGLPPAPNMRYSSLLELPIVMHSRRGFLIFVAIPRKSSVVSLRL